MTRYALGQLVFAFVLAGIGGFKAVRIVFDEIDDALSHLAGLS